MIRAVAVFRPRDDFGHFVQPIVTEGVRASVEASGKLVEQEAKLICPVETGALRESIHTTVQEQGVTVVATVSSDLEYAPYVEFGTGARGSASSGAGPGPYRGDWPGQPAQPFLRPAIDTAREAIRDIFKEQIGVAFKSA